jgi:hypothetical protein
MKSTGSTPTDIFNFMAELKALPEANMWERLF